MKRLGAGFDHLIHGLAIFSALLFCLMGLVIIGQITLRYLFNMAPLWMNDTVEYILLTATFLGAAYVLREGQHIEIDIVVNMLAEKKRCALKMVTSALGAMVCFVVTWYGILTTVDNYLRQVVVYKSVEIPKYMVLIPICVGSLLLTIQFFRMVFYYHSLGFGTKEPTESEALPEKISV
jgi:TRAP-type C4-dicarboxylate transport system permease small subunit